jgi:hypothetical protein
MTPSRDVLFKAQEIRPGDWQIRAFLPGGEIKYVTGFKSEASIEEWLASERCQTWLRDRGYGK